MLDFFMISVTSVKGTLEVRPKFIVTKSEDLMIRGGDFYAIWDEETQLWSTDELRALQLIDNELDKYVYDHRDILGENPKVLHMWDSDTGMIVKWHQYVQKSLRDNYHPLDEELIFSNTPTARHTYASKRLPYPLEEGQCPAYEEMISTLYSPEERHKLEWAIGSVVAGESKRIQKFLVLYGAPGTGKSTILNIMEELFAGYFGSFDAKTLGSASNAFALEAFKSNPLVGIQHDGDLSHIEDNTRLNSLVSHEMMTVNEKFRSAYSNRFNTFLFMGTNKPVRISDSKSGIIRRLVDVTPSGAKIKPISKYNALKKQIGFELGAIAYHCRQVYLENPNAYDNYIPVGMISATNDLWNFVLDSYEVFKKEDGVSLKRAYEMYLAYCEEVRNSTPMKRIYFQEELKSYFRDFKDRVVMDNDIRVRSYYSGFITDKFISEHPEEVSHVPEVSLVLKEQESLLDILCADQPAQYATAGENPHPAKKWVDVTTTLKDILSSRLHYMKLPENHIVIDFDIRNESGEKDLELNLKEAAKWPATYAELSQSGNGVHLHYIYTGDTKKLSSIYSEHVEIKVFTGNSSLRRKLTKCNDIPIATISSGLPLKEEKKMIDFEGFKSEKALRTFVARNLVKTYHAGTKPSIDFIFSGLQRAYESGLKYDLSDMYNDIYDFGMHSTNHSEYCLDRVREMKMRSEDFEPVAEVIESPEDDLNDIYFFDLEVLPNVNFLVYKRLDAQDCVRYVNPSPQVIENLLRLKIVGFNCRRYDNHILHCILLGNKPEQVYQKSWDIIHKVPNAMYGVAYNYSYTDIYDFASDKKSLKKWEIELGIHHQELPYKWDEPLPEERWNEVLEYCENDVRATEALWKARQADFVARSILASIAGMTVNDTTNSLTTRIIFGTEKHPKLVYTDLATGEQY